MMFMGLLSVIILSCSYF